MPLYTHAASATCYMYYMLDLSSCSFPEPALSFNHSRRKVVARCASLRVLVALVLLPVFITLAILVVCTPFSWLSCA